MKSNASEATQHAGCSFAGTCPTNWHCPKKALFFSTRPIDHEPLLQIFRPRKARNFDFFFFRKIAWLVLNVLEIVLFEICSSAARHEIEIEQQPEDRVRGQHLACPQPSSALSAEIAFSCSTPKQPTKTTIPNPWRVTMKHKAEYKRSACRSQRPHNRCTREGVKDRSVKTNVLWPPRSFGACKPDGVANQNAPGLQLCSKQFQGFRYPSHPPCVERTRCLF